MNGLLAGRVVLITGAGRGIGRELAQAFAAAGADLVLAARRQDDLEAVAALVQTEGQRVEVVQTDVRDEASVARLAEACSSSLGGVNVLVNNAGVGAGSEVGPGIRPLWMIEPADWDAVFDTNLRGVYLMLRAFLPPMLQRGGGTIINVSSPTVDFTRVGLGPYGASKSGLNYLTRTVAHEVADRDLRIYGLHPGGVVDTDFFGGAELPPEVHRSLASPDVLNAAALRLVSERPSELHGQNLNGRLYAD